MKALEFCKFFVSDDLSFEFHPLSDTPGTTKIAINIVNKKEVVELAKTLLTLAEGFEG